MRCSRVVPATATRTVVNLLRRGGRPQCSILPVSVVVSPPIRLYGAPRSCHLLNRAGSPECEGNMAAAPTVQCFHHVGTGTCVYVVSDSASKDCCIIDPVLDYTATPGQAQTATTHMTEVLGYVRAEGLKVRYIVETHVHADHITAADAIKRQLVSQGDEAPKIVIGQGVVKVQETWKALLNLPWLKADGSDFDILANDGDEWPLGSFTIKCISTPGHTPDSNSYLVGNALFPGDTVFMPDSGTARCDFPNGSASLLYDSVAKLFALPDDTNVFVCHDYGAGKTREYKWQTTIGEQKEKNTSVGGGISKDAYVTAREARDATLNVPALLYPALQFNLAAGRFPADEINGTALLKIPVKQPA